MKIERAMFVDGDFRGFYILERCETYILYNPKREHCIQCNGETKFHWKKRSEIDHIALLFFDDEDKAAIISKMVRLDITRLITEFIPFEWNDLDEY